MLLGFAQRVQDLAERVLGDFPFPHPEFTLAPAVDGVPGYPFRLSAWPDTLDSFGVSPPSTVSPIPNSTEKMRVTIRSPGSSLPPDALAALAASLPSWRYSWAAPRTSTSGWNFWSPTRKRQNLARFFAEQRSRAGSGSDLRWPILGFLARPIRQADRNIGGQPLEVRLDRLERVRNVLPDPLLKLCEGFNRYLAKIIGIPSDRDGELWFVCMLIKCHDGKVHGPRFRNDAVTSATPSTEFLKLSFVMSATPVRNSVDSSVLLM